jgi:hypothetical protein
MVPHPSTKCDDVESQASVAKYEMLTEADDGSLEITSVS